MLPEKNISRTIEKQKRLVKMLRERIFVPVGQANLRGVFQTTEPLFEIPADSMLSPVADVWGGKGIYAWFKATIPCRRNWPESPFSSIRKWVITRACSG